MSFFSVLLIIFVVLKLVGLITWSWLWVLAPFWMPLGVYVFFVIALAVLSSIR